MANVQVGAGMPGASTRGFGRVIGKVAAWYPIDRNTTLYARADAGAVLADSRDGIPSNFLFRTGGDTTVRGYAFDSLGVKLGDAIVGAATTPRPASRSRAGSARTGDSRRSSIPAMPSTRCTTSISPGDMASAAGSARPSDLSAWTSRTGNSRRACACTSPSGFHYKRARDAGIRSRQDPATPMRGWRWVLHFSWVGAVLAVAIGAGIAWLTTQQALDLAVARAVGASEGRLTVERATGSLLSTVRVTRIAWRGDDVEVEADDVALTWSVVGLFTRHVDVSGLGAHRLAITMKSSDSPLALPADLSLPLEVDVANVGVERVEWRVGPRAGTITGVVFDYSGGAREHSVRRLRFVTDVGTLSGEAELAAVTPFALGAALNFTGDAAYRDTRADVSAKGNLATFALSAKGTMRNAAVTANATLTPFAATPLADAHVDAKDVDIAVFAPALPSTRLSVTLDARAMPDGFAGTLAATNANAGALDASRVPLASLNSPFRWNGRELRWTTSTRAWPATRGSPGG